MVGNPFYSFIPSKLSRARAARFKGVCSYVPTFLFCDAWHVFRVDIGVHRASTLGATSAVVQRDNGRWPARPGQSPPWGVAHVIAGAREGLQAQYGLARVCDAWFCSESMGGARIPVDHAP